MNDIADKEHIMAANYVKNKMAIYMRRSYKYRCLGQMQKSMRQLINKEVKTAAAGIDTFAFDETLELLKI